MWLTVSRVLLTDYTVATNTTLLETILTSLALDLGCGLGPSSTTSTSLATSALLTTTTSVVIISDVSVVSVVRSISVVSAAVGANQLGLAGVKVSVI